MPSPQTLAELRAALAEAERIAAEQDERPLAGPQDHRPKQLVPTTAKGWRGKLGAPHPLELPSGNVCLVKRPGLPQLLKDGVLPDVLTPMAEKVISSVDKDEASSGIDDDLRDIMSQPDGMEKMFDAVERVAARVVVEPELRYSKHEIGHPDGPSTWELIPEDLREEDVLYTDQVDLNDLMFIFQYVVGGSRDLEEFRKQTG